MTIKKNNKRYKYLILSCFIILGMGLLYRFWAVIILLIPFRESSLGQISISHKSASNIFIKDTSEALAIISEGKQIINSNTDSAIGLLVNALQWSAKQNFILGLGKSNAALSIAYCAKGEFAKSDSLLNMAKMHYDNVSNNEYLLLNWQIDKALLFKLSGKTDSAVVTLFAIQKEVEIQGKDSTLNRQYYHLIGSVLIDNRDYERAFPFLNKALSYHVDENSSSYISILTNLTYVYDERGDIASVYANAIKVMQLSVKNNFPRYQRSSALILTKYFLKKNDLVSAKKYADKAIALIDGVSKEGVIYVYRVLADLYSNVNLNAKALEFGRKAMQQIGPEHYLRHDIIETYNTMADIYMKLGDSDSAIKYLRIYTQLSDSLNLTERNKTIDKLEKQFQLAEKDKQLLIRDSQIRNRNWWIIVVALVLLGVLVVAIFYYRNARRNLQILKQQKQIDELKAKVSGEENERSRIAKELHDGVGGLLSAAAINLNNLGNKNSTIKSDHHFANTYEIINQVSADVRMTAHNLMPEVLFHHNLSDAIKIFCTTIQKGRAIDINVLSSGTFDDLAHDLLLASYRIIQELVHNAIKYAQAAEILVQIQRSKDVLSITVEDNGIGFNSDLVKSGSGLMNISDRVKSFSGRLSINSPLEEGTSVYIEFDLEE